MKTVALHNLGCKVNAYEMDVMQQMLQKDGYKIVTFEQKADVYVINTCTVTNIADRKSRQMLHRAKHLNPGAVVIAAGCYAETDRDKIEEDNCIDLWVGNNHKKDIATIVDRYFEARIKGRIPGKDGKLYLDEVQDVTSQETEENQFACEVLERTADHTRAYIKIQDGCNRFCTYCIIPYARGRVISRTPDDILNEIRALCENGYREFVLTGIHISSYGIDFAEKRDDYLLSLIQKIASVESVERIRIGSLEPMIVTEDFVKGISEIRQMCPHFHLSLQSGDDSVLKRMNRRYSAGEYLEKIRLIRKYFEHPAITTDVIVGFPGETETEFENTVHFLTEVGFYEMHVFKYSKRKGTPAAIMPYQISDEIKNLRSDRLLCLREQQTAAFREYYIGRRVGVLMEEKNQINGVEYWVGYSPEYIRFAIPSEDNLQNKVVYQEVTGFLTEEILLLKEESYLEF